MQIYHRKYELRYIHINWRVSNKMNGLNNLIARIRWLLLHKIFMVYIIGPESTLHFMLNGQVMHSACNAWQAVVRCTVHSTCSICFGSVSFHFSLNAPRIVCESMIVFLVLVIYNLNIYRNRRHLFWKEKASVILLNAELERTWLLI